MKHRFPTRRSSELRGGRFGPGHAGWMKSSREIMEILEAYDLTGSYRAAAELAGCDHHTVARYVQMRAAGQPPDRRRHRARAIDDFLPKIEELVVRSQGKVRAVEIGRAHV